jgi:hypothetical protein
LPLEELVHSNVWGQPLEDAALESALRNTEHNLNARDVE